MKITIYTTNECQFSKQEKDFLTSHNLQFEEKNLETNREYLTEMLALSNNFAGTPVTKIEKDSAEVVVLKGFTQAEFEKELGLAVAEPAAPAVAAPAEAPAPVTEAAAPMPAAEPAPQEAAPAPTEAPMQQPSDTGLMPPAPIMSAPMAEPAQSEPAPTTDSLPPLEVPTPSVQAPDMAAPSEPMPAATEPAPQEAAPVTAMPPADPVAPPAPPAPAETNPQQSQALNSILTSLQTNIADGSEENKPADTNTSSFPHN